MNCVVEKMENKAKKGKLWHRIKYRNSVAPSAVLASDNLRQFAIELKRRHRVMLYINKMVRKTKSEERSIKVAPLHKLPSTDDDIGTFCRDCPSTAMSRFQEKDILRKVAARGLELHHPTLLNNIMAETREDFLTITQKSGIEMKLRLVEKQFQIQPYKHLGRTDNYSVFLQRRKELKSKFILHHPLIRRILDECVTNLPYELFNLNSCFKSQLDTDEFQKHIFDYANDAAQRLQEFYRKIVMLVEHEKINAQKVRSYLGACTGLLSVNISRTVAHTLLHVVSFTGSKEHVPYLKLNITFKDGLILQPTYGEIIQIYSKFLRKIIDSSKQFYVLEKYKIKGFEGKQIFLCLTEEFFDSILKQISCNIERSYEPILKYIKQLDDDFVDVYGDLCSRGDAISADLIFEEGCKKLSYYKSYLPKVAFIPDNAYFTIGQLRIVEYREILKQTLLDIADSIFNNLSAQHEWENNDICEAFDIIYIRATQKPITTEEVIEIGKYMAWVRLEYLDELRERVIKALAYLTKLIQLGPLKENHIITNAKAINWLDEILPILEENSITYEQLKFEAEEKLQRVIEDINVDIKDVYPLLDILDSMDNIEKVRGYLNTITLHMVKIKKIESKIDWINKEEISLSFPKSSYSEFDELKNYVYPFYHLLKMCLDVQRNLSVWLDGQFDLINYGKVKETVEKFYKELLRTQKVYRNKLRQAQDENLSLRFKGTVDDPDMLNWPAPLKLCSKAIKLIQDFEPSLAVIKIMCNEALMKRHWQKMSKVAGFDIIPNAGTTLRKIIHIDLKPNIDKYESISFSAIKERELFQNLEQMLQEWSGVNFESGYHKEVKIIVQMEDIEVVADDHIIKVINMLNSIYVKPYDYQVKDFYNELLKVTKTVQECRQTQQQWLHFLPLFSCHEISIRMSTEANIFKQIANTYTDYVEMIHTQPNVYKTVNNTNILQDLLDCNHQFELINQGVDRYFAKIRCCFPRLYFASNQEMFRILSLTKEPTEIHRSIRSLFCEIKDLLFSENFTILGIVSENNEILYLNQTVDTQKFYGCVEMWLKELENQIRESIQRMIQEAIKNHNQEGWVLQWPCQILLAVTKIVFTLKGTDAINNNTLDAYRTQIFKETENVVSIIKSSELNNTTRSNLKSLLAMMNYNNDVIKTMHQSNTKSDQDFKWLSQLRYYMTEDNNFVVKILDSQFNYGYEYYGNTEQIIMTPATERCYHALILAYKYFLCAGLQGSTGTGKTDTIKGLAKALAIQCSFFVCSYSVKFEVIFEFLKGIASNGSWLVLEEVNKVKTEISSLISQEIARLLIAMKEGLRDVTLNSTQIQLQKCFICCSMKSFDEIPKSFRILFRPIVMTVPDCQVIAQVMLFSMGYCHWVDLGKRMTTIFQLLQVSLPLSKTDFGLRSVKEVLNKCDKTIRGNFNEEQNIYNCICDITIPKLLSSERTVFENILTTVFPSSKLHSAAESVENSIATTCKKLNLNVNNNFITKIYEIYKIMCCKKGTIIVGSTFTAKTTSIRILSNIFPDKSIKVVTVNPKTLTLKQLYGGIDTDTQQWCDGIITKYLRQYSEDETWIILDGPADPLWVEEINSVLDENRKLCLSSGEVLHLKDNSKIILELENLNLASPTTICRCGITYMDQNVFEWKSLVESWIQDNGFEWQKGFEEMFLILFEWAVPPCLEFMTMSCHQLCNVSKISLVKSTIQILEMFLTEAYEAIARKEDDPKNLSSWIQASFIQAVVWGIGSNLDQDSRLKFDEFFKQLWRGQNKFHPYPKSLEKVEVSVPTDEIIFDHSYLYKSKGNWKFWPDVLKNEKVEECRYLSDIFVPTNESIKYATIINMHISHNYPLLLVGPSGTGKTLNMLEIVMNKLDLNLYELNLLTFTSKVTPNQAREIMLSKLFKKKSGRYGPSEGKRSLFFIDDFSEPSKDELGTQQTLEVIRELLDHKKWYNLENFKPLYIDNINLLAAMTSSRDQHTCQRLLRHFNVFSINELPEDSILRIFSNILLTKWKRMGFPSDIIGTINQIVAATHHFYKSVSDLKPTLSWNFYYFHMKNFSKIIQVCSMIRKESADANKKIFFKLWTHEILRVLGDRLLDTDKKWLFDNIKFCVDQYFKEELAQLFENLLRDDSTEPDLSKVLFGTYLDKNSGRFDETEIDKLEEIAASCLKEYNQENLNKIDLVLFNHALEHVSNICRVLAIPRCNLIQVGMCGTGRQTLVQLACLIYSQTFFKLQMTENYNHKDWHEAVKSFLKEAGGHGKHCTFFLKEEQIIHDAILDDLDHLLKTGQIPFLYSMEENQEILDLVRSSMQEKEENRNVNGDSESIFFYHQKCCRENLHVIISFNHGSSMFRRFSRKYSSLFKFCEINYLKKWPEESLQSIARAWIEDLNIGTEMKMKVSSSFSFFHKEAETISDVYVTTGSYMAFVRLYVDLIIFKQKKITDVKQRYLAALDKLSIAACQISEMQKSLADYQPQLEAMTKQAIEMAKQIETETVEVEKASDLVKKDEEIANEQAAAAQVLKLDCEADLAQAIPILEDAISALNTLKPTDITLVKSMKNPPDAIKLVMAAVCVIKDVKPDRIPDPSTGRKTIDYWGPSKRILGDMNFLQTLKDFDKDNIKPEIMVKIRKDYLPHKDFKPHVVAKASSAAEGLCKWIIAMDMYDKVAKEVAPKKEKLTKAEQEYGVTMIILNEKKEQVARIEQKLADLNATLKEATRKQKKLQRDVDICKKKLNRAQKLIGGLSEEKIRWTNAADQLQQQYERLPGDVLLSSAVVAYLGPFRINDRNKILTAWVTYVHQNDITFTEGYDFLKTFEKDVDYDKWHLNGLPTDRFFIENGIIAKFSKKWPLFIDPQKQANNWIKLSEKQNGIVVTKFTNPNYINLLKDCITSGAPILLENVEQTLKPFLNNLITKNIVLQNESECLEIGGHIISYNRNFVLYMTTNSKYPVYTSEIYDKITIIDFAMNKKSLEDHLLTCVVELEKPTMKKIKSTLNTERKRNKDELNNIEERIIKTLSESKTDILEDEQALQILDESKVLSKKIQQKQQDSVHVEKSLNDFRTNYETVAQYSTNLYFTTYQLTKINHMYQFSYNWFIETYSEAIQKAHRFKLLHLRLKSLIDTLTYELYSKVCRSIFEEDKLLFSFLLCTNMLLSDGKITIEEIQLLIEEEVEEAPTKGPEWLPHESWNKICNLKKLNVYKDFPDFFLKDEDKFRLIFYSNTPENETFPELYNFSFVQLLIIKCIRPDRVYLSICNFLKSEFGPQFVKPPSFDIASSFIESYILSPLMFILKTGTDSVNSLLSFAKTKNFHNKLILASMKPGQEDDFDTLLEKGKKLGLWICLQNCHLLTSWLPLLDLKLDEIDYSNTHENFRLWLTTDETTVVPISLLERSIKITKESPMGIKNKMEALFTRNSCDLSNLYANCPGNHEMFVRLLYSMAFMHCVLQERRKFGSYGFNIPYDFNDTDLFISVCELQDILNQHLDPFEEIVYLMENCTYGGYITDPFDSRLLGVIVRDYLNPLVAKNEPNTFINIYGPGYPPKTDYQDSVSHVLKLPETDDITVFGLPKNYDTLGGSKESKLLLQSIGMTFNNTRRYKTVLNISELIEELMYQLPVDFEFYIDDTTVESIIDLHILEELKSYNKLLSFIKTSLKSLQSVVDGCSFMDVDLETMSESITNNQVPSRWLKMSCTNSYYLSSFTSDLNVKVNYFKDFKYSSSQNIWLGSFFYPKTFLTAVKLFHSQLKSRSIDEIVFHLKNVTEYSECSSVLITGLYLTGSSWNEKSQCLEELLPNVIHHQMPPVIFVFSNECKDLFQCPLYTHLCYDYVKNSNFILPVLIQTEKCSQHWIRRGTSLLCQV